MSIGGELPFGAWLRQRRKERGVGPDALAARIGCSTIALLKIESGERRPSRQIALLLAEFLAVPEDEQEVFVAFARNVQPGTPANVRDATNTTQFAKAAHGAPAASPSGHLTSDAPWRITRLHETNLPHALTPLFGREKEVEEATGLLLQPRVRLLTLTGAPGIGKTRLALEIASHLLGRFEDWVCLVELAAIDDPELVPAAIARTLGIKETASERIEATLSAYLREKHILLLLDNFEHLLDASPGVIRLLESSPWLKVLATSREALHVRGERRYPVQLLGIPIVPTPDQPLDVASLAAFPSVQLFVDRAQDIDNDFVLNEENGADVAAVCAAFEGLPLAIELAAARIKRQSPREMRSALSGRLRLLIGGARDLPARQRTLRNAIEWSYSLLTPEEQSVFRRLGVFVGGFTAQAVEALYASSNTAAAMHAGCIEVTDGDGVGAGGAVGDRGEGTPIVEILQSLADKSLVKLERPGSEIHAARFGMLETIRELAGEKLEEVDWSKADSSNGGTSEEGEVELAHAFYFVRLVEEIRQNLGGLGQVERLARLEEDYANITEAMRWATRRGSSESRAGIEKRVDVGLRLVHALFDFWFIRGYFTEARQWLARMLAVSSSLPLTQGSTNEALQMRRADLCLDAGVFAHEQADYISGRALLEEALALYRKLDDKGGIARVLGNLGVNAYEQGDYARARRFYEESLAISRELGDKRRVAWMLTNVGLAAQMQGDLAEARALQEQSLNVSREVGDRISISLSLQNLGLAALGLGDYAAARAFHEESLAIRREMGYRWGIAASLNNLANIALLEGDHEKARPLYEESLRIHREIGNRRGLAWEMAGLAGVAVMGGQAQLGAKMLGIAATLWEAANALPDAEDRLIIEYATQACENRIGEEEFGVAWNDGRSMPVQEALGFALERR